MHAVIRAIWSPDVEDLENWRPPEPDEFCILVQMLIGPAEGEGEESFDFTVCTPRWLTSKVTDRPMFLRHHLLVSRYDFSEIRAALGRLVTSCSGRDWNELASKLARYGQWEFEDYNPGASDGPSKRPPPHGQRRPEGQ